MHTNATTYRETETIKCPLLISCPAIGIISSGLLCGPVKKKSKSNNEVILEFLRKGPVISGRVVGKDLKAGFYLICPKLSSSRRRPGRTCILKAREIS